MAHVPCLIGLGRRPPKRSSAVRWRYMRGIPYPYRPTIPSWVPSVQAAYSAPAFSPVCLYVYLTSNAVYTMLLAGRRILTSTTPRSQLKGPIEDSKEKKKKLASSSSAGIMSSAGGFRKLLLSSASGE